MPPHQPLKVSPCMIVMSRKTVIDFYNGENASHNSKLA